MAEDFFRFSTGKKVRTTKKVIDLASKIKELTENKKTIDAEQVFAKNINRIINSEKVIIKPDSKKLPTDSEMFRYNLRIFKDYISPKKIFEEIIRNLRKEEFEKFKKQYLAEGKEYSQLFFNTQQYENLLFAEKKFAHPKKIFDKRMNGKIAEKIFVLLEQENYSDAVSELKKTKEGLEISNPHMELLTNTCIVEQDFFYLTGIDRFEMVSSVDGKKIEMKYLKKENLNSKSNLNSNPKSNSKSKIRIRKRINQAYQLNVTIQVINELNAISSKLATTFLVNLYSQTLNAQKQIEKGNFVKNEEFEKLYEQKQKEISKIIFGENKEMPFKEFAKIYGLDVKRPIKQEIYANGYGNASRWKGNRIRI